MKSTEFLITVMVALVSVQEVMAQQFNMSPPPIDGKMSIGLKVNKPFFKKTEYGDEYSGASGVYMVYGYFPLKNSWQINAEVPLVVSKMPDYNETGLGNLYVEIQKALNTSRSTWLAIGIFIPTVDSDNYLRQFMGALTDSYRFVQYMEGVSINSTLGYNLAAKPGPIFGSGHWPESVHTYLSGWRRGIITPPRSKRGLSIQSRSGLGRIEWDHDRNRRGGSGRQMDQPGQFGCPVVTRNIPARYLLWNSFG